jgi:serine/threonine-protein kinase HipA
VDIHQPYLDRLADDAHHAGLSDRIQTLHASIESLRFPAETFDLLWAEGSAYILGLSRSLRIWRRLLLPGAPAAFTELTWLTGDPPPEAARFWRTAYPEMETIAANRRRAALEGFQVFDTFTLPESDWWDQFYTPLLTRIESLRPEALRDPDLAAVVAATEQEISLFSRFSAAFGYVFYLARRP